MKHSPFEPLASNLLTHKWDDEAPNPNQLRWNPFDLPKDEESVDFVQVSFARNIKLRVDELNITIDTLCRRVWLHYAALVMCDRDMASPYTSTRAMCRCTTELSTTRTAISSSVCFAHTTLYYIITEVKK